MKRTTAGVAGQPARDGRRRVWEAVVEHQVFGEVVEHVKIDVPAELLGSIARWRECSAPDHLAGRDVQGGLGHDVTARLES